MSYYYKITQLCTIKNVNVSLPSNNKEYNIKTIINLLMLLLNIVIMCYNLWVDNMKKYNIIM